VLLCVAVLLASWTSGAQEGRVQRTTGEGPTISAERFEQISEGELLVTGDVELRYGELRLLADTVQYNDATRIAIAEGNVVMMIGKGQITGDRLEINVDTTQATVWNAHGYMDPDVIFRAAKLERISDDTVVITDGTVTTCTQPTPYWSFHVSKATLEQDRYAYMRNVSLKASKATIFYLPYLVWPMKKDRASGLLLPNLGYSRRRGSFVGNALYLVMGRSQDVTLFLDKYGQSGTGSGFEYRFTPSATGRGTVTGYYLDDTLTGEKRYRFNINQTQGFPGGYRLLADLNKVSDLDYYLDFERDITQTTSPTVFSHLDLVRNWSNYSLNVRADRQEQFISTTEDLTLQRLPEIEFRGRGIRLGRSPFYVSFESSGGVYNKDRRFTPADPNIPGYGREVTYQRFDFFPTLSASFTPTPWLDISPSVSFRETVWSQSLLNPADPNSFVSSDDESRQYANFNLSIIGPRLFRLYGDDPATGGTRFKHTFEPSISYSYIPELTGGDKVIRFDEIDSTLAGDVNRVTYALTSRLFAKRPPKEQGSAPRRDEEAYAAEFTGPTQVQVPAADIDDLPDDLKEALDSDTLPPAVGAVEIATFDVRQEYSLDPDKPISFDTVVDPNGGLTPLDSQAGPVVATVRYNPTQAASLDLRTSYNVLLDDIDSVSLSANLRSLRLGYMRLSWFLNRDLGGTPDPLTGGRQFVDASQLRLIGGTAFFRRKVTVDLEGSYDLEESQLRDQRVRLGYNTQCCGVLVELARRDFETIDEIQYRFVLNLRGVGNFLDLQGRPR